MHGLSQSHQGITPDHPLAIVRPLVGKMKFAGKKNPIRSDMDKDVIVYTTQIKVGWI